MKITVFVAFIACLAIVESHPSRLGEILKRKIASVIERRLENMPGAVATSSDHARGSNYAGQEYHNGASGAHEEGFHNSGRRHFHDIGHHHSKVTKITQAESSESHNIGGSEVYDNAAASGNRFNNYNNGAKQTASDYDRGQQESVAV